MILYPHEVMDLIGRIELLHMRDSEGGAIKNEQGAETFVVLGYRQVVAVGGNACRDEVWLTGECPGGIRARSV